MSQQPTKKSPREKKHFLYTTDSDNKSLDEVNGSVEVPENAGYWRTLLAFTGPGTLVAVGYMDPGNWITSIAGGAQYKYTLLTVILISSLIAMLLQAMAARLGIVTGKDLAQLTRERTSKGMGIFLWIVTELAIMATDMAEIIGSGIALKLLFGFPLIVGIIITAFDVLLLLLLMKLGFRKIEAIVAGLVAIILIVFTYEVILARPDIPQIFAGYVPNIDIMTNKGMLYLSLGIVGATVMPHNLYLGSSISQTRKYDRTDKKSLAKAIRFTVADSNIQLTLAFVVNSLLLILGAALFFGTNSDLGRFVDLFNALNDKNIVGAIASPLLSSLFAIALLSSGQSSTITGTLSGQIIMEGFIHLKMPLWAQRLLTRLLSVLPVLIFAIYYHGNEARIENLLTFSQVFLSVALPFAIIPLVIFTSNKDLMGDYANRSWVKYIAWIIAIILIILNVYLILQTIGVMA
ncbi:manganese transporter [Loigolactobacillus coryniformis subsp. coryniformis]|jgi:manganese transport protein|uniref:Divalent metal cation transporter MntH n=2 Tax=Loigolactobacillus coryniformis TaxID=1610 RepID=A0A0R1F0J3_9LACO|nr:Nramp family divalent metal transporter [Loigolactobacillus coryniformis]OEH90956.1 manganese transporter [Loigolactobacillus coryniformis subsp. coryniformis]ATO44893.1 divalent metal cation transporter [Loigolactobacillus coryniformis subsp. torquens DSM 20004 = KCTC 3535]ATO56592.1 divalent metal cation transporter [Loigolactobacillus coryniformis subsp. coryniformis KCTC 3167 = DSM 20001]KRK15327.1 manganese transport protein MntH [Loigolactobacillus coryniformis subsp. coryniformis KCTC